MVIESHLNISRWLTPTDCLFSTPHLRSTRCLSLFKISVPQALHPSFLASCQTSWIPLPFLPNILLFIIFFSMISPILINNSFPESIMNTSIFQASIHIMMILISSMDRPTVDLRLPKLLILLTTLWAIITIRQFQTFIPAMSEERTIQM